ncbi:MAG: TetR family transcriptional regulator, partial [Cellulomonadaceae bacterium]
MSNDDASRGPTDSIGSAARALAEATAALTKVLSNQIKDVVPEVGEAVATSLREASQGLASASEDLQRSTGRAGSARRQARADQTRADLLAAAARDIAALGYEGATVDDIATEAGYTKGAVYAHF